MRYSDGYNLDYTTISYTHGYCLGHGETYNTKTNATKVRRLEKSKSRQRSTDVHTQNMYLGYFSDSKKCSSDSQMGFKNNCRSNIDTDTTNSNMYIQCNHDNSESISSIMLNLYSDVPLCAVDINCTVSESIPVIIL